MQVTNVTAARGPLRKIVPSFVGLLCAWLLWRQASALDWHAVLSAFAAIPAERWLLATLATAGSFWALAQYDVVAHRHLETGAPDDAARSAGAASIALGQVIGFGPVIGAAVRWRLMPALGHGTILRLTAFVTLSFFASWGVLSLVLFLPLLGGFGWAVPILTLLIGAVSVAVLMRFPILRLGRLTLRLPSLTAAMRLAALCLIDVACAGTALWALLPPEASPALPLLIAAYALALGAGLVGGTPGGVGPFELALAALLPAVGPETLAASILGFRLLYYALPAVIAAGHALTAKPVTRLADARDEGLVACTLRAESAIAAQATVQPLTTDDASACLLHTPQTLTLFLGARHGMLRDLLGPLTRAAMRQNRVACLYKITARDAASARDAGWTVAQHSAEAVIDPAGFDLNTPARRQLRRFLRKAEKAGVTVSRMANPDWRALAQVNAAWAEAHGGERGLTMGRFCPAYLQDKPLFVAHHNGRIIGFVSAVTAPGAWSLDLIRHTPDAPSGTNHALVTAMIDAAGRDGCHEVSLAALPTPRLMRVAPGAEGLARFKESFGPVWRPLYIAAPNRVALTVAALDLWQAVTRPAPLPEVTPDVWTHPVPSGDEAPELRLAS